MATFPNASATSQACYTCRRHGPVPLRPAGTDRRPGRRDRRRPLRARPARCERLRGERSHNTLVHHGRRRASSCSRSPAPANRPPRSISTPGRWSTSSNGHPGCRSPACVRALDGELVPVVDARRQAALHALGDLPARACTFDDDQAISTGRIARRSARSSERCRRRCPTSITRRPRASWPWDIANGLIVDAELWSGLGATPRSLLGARPRPRLSAALDDHVGACPARSFTTTPMPATCCAPIPPPTWSRGDRLR